MAKIHTLKISNFRGIQNFEQIFGMTDFVCIIGRGDSGKTTILDAISCVLFPNWNLSVYDTDFFNGIIDNPIVIAVSLYDLPKKLLQESKYGLYIRGLDKDTQEIHDKLEDQHEPILTIKLVIEKDLEPRWFVVNNRDGQEPVEIRASDRASLNVFLVSDYVDRHFSWNKGNPLYSLLNQEEKEGNNDTTIMEALREAKEKIDAIPFTHLDAIVSKIKNSASGLGINISNTSTTIDARDISIKDGKICLHEDKIPFRLKGKGSKRLISIAIQTELAKSGGIILIDEIEQGLEPDRAQHLAQTLKKNNKGQVFITTHSRDVLVELQADNLYRMNNDGTLSTFNSSLQGCLRTNPEAFFSERVLVCEGATEIGFCRGLNSYRISQGKNNASYKGVRFADGKGASQVEYAKGFLSAGYDVCLFCDSDVEEINTQKEALIKAGIKIIDSDKDKSLESHLFEDLPWAGIKELLEYRIEEKDEASVADSVKSKYTGTFPSDWKDSDTKEMRTAIYQASIVKKHEWFKRTNHGEFIGLLCCKYLGQMDSKKIKIQTEALSKWIDNDNA